MSHRIFAWVLVLTACGGGSNDGSCPTALQDGDACAFADRCWRENTFSSCESGWCTCEAGRVHCAPLAPDDGDLAGDEPITQCSYEGNQSCTTLPTAEACVRTGDVWRCDCACYGGLSTCGPLCPTGTTPARLAGKLCGEPAAECVVEGKTCRCVAPGADEPARFVCDP